jgi:hypothetical protein
LYYGVRQSSPSDIELVKDLASALQICDFLTLLINVDGCRFLRRPAGLFFGKCVEFFLLETRRA